MKSGGSREGLASPCVGTECGWAGLLADHPTPSHLSPIPIPRLWALWKWVPYPMKGEQLFSGPPGIALPKVTIFLHLMFAEASQGTEVGPLGSSPTCASLTKSSWFSSFAQALRAQEIGLSLGPAGQWNLITDLPAMGLPCLCS